MMDATLAAIVDLIEQWAAGQVASEHAASQQIIDGLHAQLSAALTQHDTDAALIEQLRARIAELEAQVPKPPEPPPTPEPPPPVPVWAGLLYGANDSHWSSLAPQVPGMQVRRSYAGTWPGAPTARMQEDWKAGRVPYVSFSDTNPTDANLAAFFRSCTGKAIVTPVHEVDNGKMTAAAYVSLLKRVHAAKEANAVHPEQVLVGPTLMGWT
ncbi:MAG TPA: hypothetical protein VFJ94_14500, partial [Intrasporangium sp.]|uniref:hypothetical protein n=1 Tax=Intrasporangium sp. TaxID=1925024 RepID=UPI002D77E1B6